MKKIIMFLLVITIAQVLVWFQTYGQYKWEWLGKNIWFLLLFSIPITCLWLLGTKMGMGVFDGKTWPLRFVGFCSGIIVFAFLSKYVLNEEMSPRTIVSLILCCLII